MPTLTFFHAPQTRSSGTAVLLEELQAPHEVRLVNMKAGEQRQPAFLAVNPMGKVPALLYGGVLVAEQVAITLFLADLFPMAGLAPAPDAPARGAYLRWTAFYGSCFEPAMVDRAMKRDPGRASMSPYGTFEDMFGTLTAQLEAHPYIAGDTLTAADILWGGALGWMIAFGLVPDAPVVKAYSERINARPSFVAVTARDKALADEHAKAAGA